MKTRTWTKMLAMAMVVSFLMVGSAMADLTIISDKSYDGGNFYRLLPDNGILDRLYGMNNLQRVDDDEDQSWLFSEGASALAQVKYASNFESFGYITDTTGDGIFDTSSFTEVFTVPQGSAYNFDNSTSNANYGYYGAINITQPFAFADKTNGNTFYSVNSLNADRLDHMVTWKIIGNGDGYSDNVIGNYVVAFEDLFGDFNFNYKGGSDRDFNDLIVEINPTPEPGTILLLGAGLAGLVVFRKKFRK